MTHDPSIARQGNTWYVFATGKAPGGGQLPIRCSSDLENWRYCGQVFNAIPDWIHQASPATPDLWAPDISFYKSEYRLYYSYSLFGKNTSGIALVTNKTLDPKDPQYKWNDRGLVLRTVATDDYNAIDPNFITGADGTSWLVFGSYWSGIKLRQLNADGLASTENTRIYSVAARERPANPGPDWRAIERRSCFSTTAITIFLCRGICAAGARAAIIGLWLAAQEPSRALTWTGPENRCSPVAAPRSLPETRAGTVREASPYLPARRPAGVSRLRRSDRQTGFADFDNRMEARLAKRSLGIRALACSRIEQLN